MFTLSFTNFNLLEGVFWIGCAVVSVLFRDHFLIPRFWYLLSVDFILFGLSDFVEAYYPKSFLDPGAEWLLVWKITCLVWFCNSLVWYISMRIKNK
jgi:hypothetical protein